MDEKEELISGIESILGLTPANTRLILNVLAHPELIEHTKRYIRSKDYASRCTKYETPWDCIKEAEAKFENIKFGWLGSGNSSVELSLDWLCEACHRRITED